MTVRFLIDAQLPPALARHLASLGHNAIHVADIAMAAARDRDVWARAAETGAVLVTKDEDFVTMRALQRRGPAVIWVRIGNTTRREIIARFDAVFAEVLAALERGETIVQVSEA